MKERLRRIAKWAVYPTFYFACLALFGYLTFPFGLLKDRVIAEFARKGKPGQRLEIEKLSSYWFSGVELTNVKLMIPFCRRIEEAEQVLQTMARHGLARGQNGLEIYVMCEIPNNVIQVDAFALDLGEGVVQDDVHVADHRQ